MVGERTDSTVAVKNMARGGRSTRLLLAMKKIRGSYQTGSAHRLICCIKLTLPAGNFLVKNN